MDNDERSVWERYVASWKVESPEEKRALYVTCLSPECVYADPLAQAKGWDELIAYMMDFHKQLPGAHFVTDYFLAHHRQSIARWKMMSGDAVLLGEGISHGKYDEDNRLVSMTGFFEARVG